MCNVICPKNCTCLEREGYVECWDALPRPYVLFFPLQTRRIILHFDITHFYPLFFLLDYLVDLILSETDLDFLQKNIFWGLGNLKKLNVSNNNLTHIPDFIFSSLGMLGVLDLSNNHLKNITSNSFAGLLNLKELYMKCTHLETIEEDLFSHLGHLQKLDLSNSGITTVKDGAFNGLQYLRQLYLQTNNIITYGQYIVKDLTNLVELHTDTNNLCCPHYRPARLENCFSPKASISSCKDLMANSFLRVAIWVLCIATLTGNILSVGLRICWERRSFMNGYSVFVTHLAVSDFIMGLYLLIIAIADTRYQGIYVLKDQEWRSSVFCKIAGFLSTLSSEASALFISLITVDRFLVIKYPFQQIKITFRSAMACSVLVWIAAGVIAGIPLLPQLSNWEFYNKNGACLAVPFFTEKKPGWIYSACVFIGLNFVAFIFIAFGQYSIYRKIKEVSVMSNQDRGSQDMEVAKRLLLIVSTDFLCWFPVGIMSEYAFWVWMGHPMLCTLLQTIGEIGIGLKLTKRSSASDQHI